MTDVKFKQLLIFIPRYSYIAVFSIHLSVYAALFRLSLWLKNIKPEKVEVRAQTHLHNCTYHSCLR